MKRIEHALSNDVYHDEGRNIIVKHYSKDKFKKAFGNQELNVLNKLGYQIDIINKDKIEFQYIEHKPFDDQNISLQDLTSVINSIKSLHRLETSAMKLTPFESVYKQFLLKGNGSKEGWFDEYEEYIFNKAIKILSSGKQVILHNDLVEGNLLKVKNTIKLIDFEYSGLGNPIFDIASFITERELTQEQIDFLVACYDKKISKDDLNIVCAFLQIFWTRWALFKYKTEKKEIYKVISEIKFKGYRKLIKNIQL